MLLKYFYDARLAQASYLVGCQVAGVAIVVDPGRDPQPYLAAADAEGLRIVAATETHIHADFVSGARELAAATGATLYLSDEGDANWKYQYLRDVPHRLLKDGDSFYIGNMRFDVLHTPGHTPEHISLLLTDTPNHDSHGATRPLGIFTGDFVFVGDVGRPDLLESVAGFAGTAEIGARQMFRSLHRFRALPDYLQVWPGHGAGSACGKALGALPSTTVGYEKLVNWAFAIEDETDFISALLTDQPEAPTYFAQMKRVNKQVPALSASLPPWPRLGLDDLAAALDTHTPVVDLRPAPAFAAGHLPGSINIPADPSLVSWAGWLLPYDRPYVLIAAEEESAPVRAALHSIGLDRAAGIADPSLLRQWRAAGRALQSYTTITPEAAAAAQQAGDVTLLDVRSRSEWETGHLPGAIHLMLGHLPQQAVRLPQDRPIVPYCRSGARSAIASGLLQAQGFGQVMNLAAGMDGWQQAGLPVVKGKAAAAIASPR